MLSEKSENIILLLRSYLEELLSINDNVYDTIIINSIIQKLRSDYFKKKFCQIIEDLGYYDEKTNSLKNPKAYGKILKLLESVH